MIWRNGKVNDKTGQDEAYATEYLLEYEYSTTLIVSNKNIEFKEFLYRFLWQQDKKLK